MAYFARSPGGVDDRGWVLASMAQDGVWNSCGRAMRPMQMRPSRQRVGQIVVVTAGHPCCNPRPVKEADALGRAGYDVTLLSMGGVPGLDSVDREVTKGAPYRHESVPFGRSLASNLFGRARVWLARNAVRAGLETIHALGIIKPLERRVSELSADMFIVHTEMPFWIGTRLLRKGRRVGADFEDWHSEDLLPSYQAIRPLRLLRRVERTLIHGAAYTSTTSVALSNALVERYGGPPQCRLQTHSRCSLNQGPLSEVRFRRFSGIHRRSDQVGAWRLLSPAGYLSAGQAAWSC